MFYWLLFLSIYLAIPVLASLKDLSHCDPLKKDAHCPPDPAVASKTSFDFTKATWDDQFTSFWTVDASTSQDKRQLTFNTTDSKGAAFNIWQDSQAPTLTSNKYMLFGKVSVEVQAAKGPGIITAIVLKSDSGDEIDWELLGAFENQAQTNYFYDGQPLFNTYNTTYHLDASSFASTQKYSIEWTPTNLSFSINNIVRKSWHVGDIPAYKWPQTPMQVKLGIWTVSNSSDPGTVAWAGGLPNWTGHDADKNPYSAYFKTVELEDYTGGCNETAKGANIEYLYDERTTGTSQPTQTSDGDKSHPSSSATTEEQPSQTGEQNPDSSEDSSNESDNAALPSGRPSSTLGAVLFLLWLLAA
ncbi:glycosyl hydrolases family 16 domain-containing protein [Trichoderma breve]|uniref:Glycosyl hydrolases family 16 domain-containing protein n=1 Tax=Trichoderma breve TaxID=2034170 RepID=A0A9W9BGR1_9HYPO|nr:glycosyl hydrolases family 16 domain-containing protein [Trichoderma breve]KAJ4862004.1 glycosyl hydrolases family 16 domain-containing protein [Trichoderma breve]